MSILIATSEDFMVDTSLSEHDWQIRAFIYEFFVANGRPPTTAETAQHFSASENEAGEAYQHLHDAHQIMLEVGTNHIRMANPLSAVVTDYRVQVNDVWLYANCAWDTVGIAAMCHADVVVEATLPVSREIVTYRVVNGQLQADEVFQVHLALPVRQWYDNLVHT
jgi:hypothetical protein